MFVGPGVLLSPSKAAPMFVVISRQPFRRSPNNILPFFFPRHVLNKTCPMLSHRFFWYPPHSKVFSLPLLRVCSFLHPSETRYVRPLLPWRRERFLYSPRLVRCLLVEFPSSIVLLKTPFFHWMKRVSQNPPSWRSLPRKALRDTMS